jgi:hypothetical protein
MDYEAVNLDEKFGLFADLWSPRIVAQMNDYHLKLVRVEGEFVWHDHGIRTRYLSSWTGRWRSSFETAGLS